MQCKRIDRGRTCDVHVIVAEIHTHWRTCRRHEFVKPEAVSLARIQGDGIGSIVHGGEELAFVLFDASGVAADTTLALGRQGLEQHLGARVVDLDLVRHRIIGHDHR